MNNIIEQIRNLTPIGLLIWCIIIAIGIKYYQYKEDPSKIPHYIPNIISKIQTLILMK